MGQTEMVLVYRLIAADTVEERIIEMLGRKEDIFENLAEISELAESTSDATDPGISESDLLRYEQQRLATSEH
jgi:SNF2 family DNA or RNA helicase